VNNVTPRVLKDTNLDTKYRFNTPVALDLLNHPDASCYKVSTNIKTTTMNAPVTLDPLDLPDAGYYKVSTNIKTMAINIPVALSPLDHDVKPEDHWHTI
jgi:hypothetical protein